MNVPNVPMSKPANTTSAVTDAAAADTAAACPNVKSSQMHPQHHASTFYALVSRMKFVERWALMRNSRPENLSEHSWEVAVLAHGLALIGKVRFGRTLNPEHAAILALFHDAPEIITGDLPTPVKYAQANFKAAYDEVEAHAIDCLLAGLPRDLREAYQALFNELQDPDRYAQDAYLVKLVKAADKLSALIKCIDEEHAGNREFLDAQITTKQKIDELAQELPEVEVFVKEFLPCYGKTLDALL